MTRARCPLYVLKFNRRRRWFTTTLGRKTRVVQFAHFSVKEFLTSDRLADIKADISRFHIRLEPAHTVIAQACLAILLQSDHDDRAKSTSPLSSMLLSTG
jgi:hypothetical protein